MRNITFLFVLLASTLGAQDLTQGLIINDLSPHPMQPVDKPDYLESYVDPSFGTTIRRISQAPLGEGIVPMYSTIQAWNADESMMILYDLSVGQHQLLDGQDYNFIRFLDDVNPDDLENLFWDFNDPDILYYLDPDLRAFMQYSMSAQSATQLVDLQALLPDCTGDLLMGKDVQMMSWDSDVFSFRCGDSEAYYYRLSTQELVTFSLDNVLEIAPMPAPSAEVFFHRLQTYNAAGEFVLNLNADNPEHACLGKLSNGNDALLAIAFEEGPEGGCQGDIIAHDLVTGECFPVTGPELGYGYPQSGTHLSSLAHKNTQSGWLCASFEGFDNDGQDLFDQELVIALADPDNPIVCRIGHHRSDEEEIDYWGEPHASISPTGTRVLFASDWSGVEDGQSIDSYVVELPAFSIPDGIAEQPTSDFKVLPNPAKRSIALQNTGQTLIKELYIIDAMGRKVMRPAAQQAQIDISSLAPGLYFLHISSDEGLSVLRLVVD